MTAPPLHLAKAGWRLLPIRVDDKRPHTKHSYHDASTDPAQIEAWASQWANCRWGVALAASGLVAVDVDNKKVSGDENLPASWRADTLRQDTQTAGAYHLIYSRPAGCPTARFVGAVPGVDLLSDGYIVLYNYSLDPATVALAPADVAATLTKHVQQTTAQEMTVPYDGRVWEATGGGDTAWEAADRTQVRTAADEGVERVLSKLRECATWEPGEYPQGEANGWDKTIANAAQSLHTYLAEGWGPHSEAELYAAYIAAAPQHDAGPRIAAEKWRNQTKPATDGGRIEPPPFTVIDGEVVMDNRTALDRQRLDQRVEYLRADREARRILDAEDRATADGDVAPLELLNLAQLLALPDEPPFRVDELIPANGSTLITAARKTGKSTLVLNLARSLITGEPFLDSYMTRPVNGAVALLNFEVSARQIASWASDVDVPDDRLLIMNLRGRRNPLGNDADRATLVKLLRERGVESLIVDPFGRAFTGDSENDAGEVSRWLQMLEQIKKEAGALDLVLTNHAGWSGTRSRGSSALEDWPDSLIKMRLLDAENPASCRFFSAFGRDVDIPEGALAFDEATRRLSYTGESLASVRASDGNDQLLEAVLDYVAGTPGVNTTRIAQAMRCHKNTLAPVLKGAVDSGQLIQAVGPRGAHIHTIGTTGSSSSAPVHTGTGSVLNPIGNCTTERTMA